jgi:hypothetical protein
MNAPISPAAMAASVSAVRVELARLTEDARLAVRSPRTAIKDKVLAHARLHPAATSREIWEAIGRPCTLATVSAHLVGLRKSGVLRPARDMSTKTRVLAYALNHPDARPRQIWEALGRDCPFSTIEQVLIKARADGVLPRRRRVTRSCVVALPAAEHVQLAARARALHCTPEALAATLLRLVLEHDLVAAVLDGDAPC